MNRVNRITLIISILYLVTAQGYPGYKRVVSTKGKIGIVDSAERLIIDTLYDYISEPRGDEPFIVVKTYITSCGNNQNTGKIYSSPKEQKQTSAGIDTLPTRRKGIRKQTERITSIKLVDKTGKDILPFYYMNLPEFFPKPEFDGGLLPVLIKDTCEEVNDILSLSGLNKYGNYKVGFINTVGKLVIDTLYDLDNALAFVDYHQVPVCGNDNRDYHDYPKRLFLKGDFYKFYNGQCLVSKNGQSFIINANADSLFAIKYFGAIRHDQGYWVCREKCYGPMIILTQGGTVDQEETCSCGVINRNGDTVIPFKYASIGELHDGFFAVSIGRDNYNGSSFIDTNGHFISRKRYYRVNDFDGGRAYVFGKYNKQKWFKAKYSAKSSNAIYRSKSWFINTKGRRVSKKKRYN